MTALKEIEAERPTLNIRGARVPGADLRNTILHDANLSGADATNANFQGADLRGANLSGTILKGANLAEVENLTIEQLSEAVLDHSTVLPAYIDLTKLKLSN
ncbi:MAG: pentapeptide repeat-containing protein [Pseudomonadota bacterium]